MAREGAALVVDDHQLAKRLLSPICWLCRLAPFLEGFHMIDVVVKVAPNAAAKPGTGKSIGTGRHVGKQ